ncbi:four helix bundle protein [Parapedobacter soli]|uniref:four helix bundle protein n=1 Tax=Parapedobacter soli TaxID=416955 RepID=UPI0021C6E189|nr:four helix bundle protein [Parapedobacter soli]
MHHLKEIHVWRKAVELATYIYKTVADFPSDERFGLTNQIKRAVVSIASNIAEGAGRNSDKEFVQFLGIANGSSYELQTQIIIARNLGLLDDNSTKYIEEQLDEIQKMIYGFQKKLKV